MRKYILCFVFRMDFSTDCLMLYMMGDPKIHKEKLKRQEVLLKKHLKVVQKANKGSHAERHHLESGSSHEESKAGHRRPTK